MSFKLLKFSKLLKVLKLLRIFRVVRYIKLLEELYEDQYEKFNLIKELLKYLAGLIIILHCLACCHIANSLEQVVIHGGLYRIQPVAGSWLENHPDISAAEIASMKDPNSGNQEDLTDWEQPLSVQFKIYVWAMFISWSHMFCIGYGLTAPNTLSECILCTISILLGATCYAFVLAMIVTVMQEMSSGEQQYTEKYNNLRSYLQYREIPFELEERIYMYYEFRFQGKVFDENQILDELNPVLRRVVLKYNQKWLIKDGFETGRALVCLNAGTRTYGCLAKS